MLVPLMVMLKRLFSRRRCINAEYLPAEMAYLKKELNHTEQRSIC